MPTLFCPITYFILQENVSIILQEAGYGFANQKNGIFKGREVSSRSGHKTL